MGKGQPLELRYPRNAGIDLQLAWRAGSRGRQRRLFSPDVWIMPRIGFRCATEGISRKVAPTDLGDALVKVFRAGAHER